MNNKNIKFFEEKIESFIKDFGVTKDTALLAAMLDSIGYRVYEILRSQENYQDWDSNLNKDLKRKKNQR